MFCEFCYEQFEEKYWNQKYCCKECYLDANRINARKRNCKKRGLGTSDFFNHAFVDDFDREAVEVRKELNFHRVKRQFS